MPRSSIKSWEFSLLWDVVLCANGMDVGIGILILESQ